MTENLQIRHIFNPLRGDFKENFYEISILQKGKMIIDYGNGHLSVKAPALFAGQSESTLYYTPLEHIKILQLRFSAQFLPNELLQMKELNALFQLKQQLQTGILVYNDEAIQQITEQISHLNDEKNLSLTMFYNILQALAQNPYRIAFPSHRATEIDFVPNSNIARVNQYMEQHFSQKITLSELAKIASLTPAAFCRYYKSKTGTSPITHLMEIRIREACQLLWNSDLTVKEIAYRCGYNESPFLCVSFKKLIGVSPITFRKQKRIK